MKNNSGIRVEQSTVIRNQGFFCVKKWLFFIFYQIFFSKNTKICSSNYNGNSNQFAIACAMYVLNRKHVFAKPLLAFNIEVGSKLWTKFIEKVEIHQRRPNSEHILNYNFGRLQQKTEWGLGSLEVTMASKLFLHLFWLNSLDQPQL